MKTIVKTALVLLILVFLGMACQETNPVRLSVGAGRVETIPGNELPGYALRNLVDGRDDTAWCQRLGPDAEAYNGFFGIPFTAVYLDTPLDLFIYSGVRPIDKFRSFDRPRRVDIELYRQFTDDPASQDAQRVSFELEDIPSVQKLRIHPDKRTKYTMIRFALHNGQAYPGTNERHMCISEVTIYEPLPSQK